MFSSIKKYINNRINDFFSADDEFVNVGAHYRDSWVAKKAANLNRGTKILDVGAGECPYKNLFNHCIYKSQDFAQYSGTKKGLQKETWNYGKIDYVSDITKIPVKDSSFDAILCTEVFEHIPEPIKSLKEFSRILKPGGRLFLTAPLASGLHQEPYYYYGGYSPHFYKKYLSQFGMEITEIVPTGGLFKHVAQEVSRAGRILGEKKHHNFNIFHRWILGRYLPQYLGKMDDEIPIKEFTIGYMIEAKKL